MNPWLLRLIKYETKEVLRGRKPCLTQVFLKVVQQSGCGRTLRGGYLSMAGLKWGGLLVEGCGGRWGWGVEVWRLEIFSPPR